MTSLYLLIIVFPKLDPLTATGMALCVNLVPKCQNLFRLVSDLAELNSPYSSLRLSRNSNNFFKFYSAKQNLILIPVLSGIRFRLVSDYAEKSYLPQQCPNSNKFLRMSRKGDLRSKAGGL
jgi:hypothetical protein